MAHCSDGGVLYKFILNIAINIVVKVENNGFDYWGEVWIG
jgi:hypothetical protein